MAVKDLSAARLEILKAVESAPEWESNRFTGAVIDYFSALSVSALPDHLVPWPIPVDWSLVQRDDQSLKRLRKASETFKDLSARPEKLAEEREMLESWHLACVWLFGGVRGRVN